MVVRVLARRPSENMTGTRWQVCPYHSAPSETVCPAISFKHKPWGAKLDFVHRVGFRLAAFVFHGFQTACFRVHFHQIQHAADTQLLRRHMHRPLKAHALARFGLTRIHPLMQRLALRRSNSSPPTPARCESARIGADRRRSVAGRKGESGACPDLPLGFRLKVQSSF